MLTTVPLPAIIATARILSTQWQDFLRLPVRTIVSSGPFHCRRRYIMSSTRESPTTREQPSVVSQQQQSLHESGRSQPVVLLPRRLSSQSSSFHTSASSSTTDQTTAMASSESSHIGANSESAIGHHGRPKVWFITVSTAAAFSPFVYRSS